MNLKEQVAVITGAASGIGLAVAKQLLAYGARVVLLDINKAILENEFGNYLQGWAEMLEEETLKFQNEEDEINEVNEITVSDITHPAVDPNAKWDLNSLFKELELPF